MTEKQYAPTKQEKKVSNKVETPKEKKESKAPVQPKNDEVKKIGETEKQEEKKKVEVKKVKKEEVVVNAKSVPVSTKYSMAICKFIKKKRIDRAIADLEEVVALRKAVPMKGEIPHRKGKIMSGRFPKRAAGYFISLLKNLKANAINHELDNPVITEAIPNMASRPLGRFGRTSKKRTHITLKAKEKKIVDKTKKQEGKK